MVSKGRAAGARKRADRGGVVAASSKAELAEKFRLPKAKASHQVFLATVKGLLELAEAGIGISFTVAEVRSRSRVVNARPRQAYRHRLGAVGGAPGPAGLSDGGLQPLPEKLGHATGVPRAGARGYD